MDIEELRIQIATGELKLEENSVVIEEGVLMNSSGDTVNFNITHGWNIVLAMECDRNWNSFNLEMWEHIHSQGYSEDELDKILSDIQTEDSHWDWFEKSICYATDQYEWFFLFANEKPQGACLIYHPKESAIDSKYIFYIEFVAVAPWNRKNPLRGRELSGVGSQLIKCALNYAVNTLGLVYGFSLHSLPQAVEYYEKIGMVNYKAEDKGESPYFEMPRNTAKELLGGV